MKKWIPLAMAAVILFSCIGTAQAVENTEQTVDGTPYIVLGEDLNKEQRKTVLDIMGLKEEDLKNCEMLSVTNKEEHKYLDEYLDSSIIGTRALSSVMVTREEPGAGLDIETENINYCTVSMYKNALITAGMEDATVVVAGPFEISGTAALIGAVKAYAQMNDSEINEEALETATNELVLTGELGDSLGNSEGASNLIAYTKQKVIEGDLTSETQIRGAVKAAAKELDIELTDAQTKDVVRLMQKVSKLDIDVDALKSQASDLFNKLKDMGLDISSEKAGNFFMRIINAIIEFFKNLFQ